MFDDLTPNGLIDAEGIDRQIKNHILAIYEKADLRGLLLKHQRPLYDQFYKSGAKKSVWLCSRRFGKSAGFLVLAFETCLRKDGAKVRYGAATQRMVEEIIVPIIHTLTQMLPPEIRPYWVGSKSKLFFPSCPQSYVLISGLDEGRSDRLRGTDMDLGVLDEAQNIDDLDYVIKDVLLPQTLTTGGRIILGGTRPKSSAHPFTEYVRDADRNGSLSVHTIYDDSRQEVLDQIPEMMKEAGGAESTTWRREYLVEEITDEDFAIIPEMGRPEVRARVIQRLERPEYFIPYTVVDLGLIDYTAAVFGYVDFLKGKKVIIDEFLVNRKDSRYIADALLSKEKTLWGDELLKNRACRRYLDGTALTVTDFNAIHNFACSMVSKDELEPMTNELRLDCVSGKLQISPNCVETIKHLQYGIWDKAHKKFARSSTFGHYDLLAATMYFIRHANLRENPYPKDWGSALHTHVIRDHTGEDAYTKRAIKDAFKL